MKIEKYILLHFDDLSKPQDRYQILVPKGAKFLGLKVLHDGIYGWYAIPEILIEETQTEEFAIILPSKSIPDNTEFVGVLDTMVQVSATAQGLMVFPVFRFKPELERLIELLK
jgi:hypothetical protein